MECVRSQISIHICSKRIGGYLTELVASVHNFIATLVRDFESAIMAVIFKLYAVVLLYAILFSCDAYKLPANFSYDGKGDLAGTLDAKNKVYNVRLVPFEADMDSAVLTTMSDLYAAGITKKVIQDGYEKEFGVRPDNQHINDDFCHEWGWYSYNYLGEVEIINVQVQPKSRSSHERYLTNDGDKPFTHTITVTSTESNSATVTVITKSEISTTAKIIVGAPELGLGAELSTTFGFSNEVGSSNTHSSSITVGDTVKVTVPPHSKRRVYLEITWTSKTADWEIPVTIDPSGRTGVDFHKRVKGHYFWGISHASLATPPFKSVMRGRLDASYDTKGLVKVDDAIPL